MDLAGKLTALLEGGAIVGRVYLEDPSGMRQLVTYGKPARAREPMVRFRGAVYYQSTQLGDGTWVYRTTDTTATGGSDPWLSEACGPGEPGWVHPSDWPAPADPEADAYGHVVAAVAALKAFPAQAELVAELEAVLRDEDWPEDVPAALLLQRRPV